jgi:hypothetical protein
MGCFMEANIQMSSRTLMCYNKCGQQIKFDDNVRAASGKKIPLNLDGSCHQCANKSKPQHQQPQQQQRQKTPILCRGCGAQIRFSKYHRTENQGWIPLNTDGSYHECPMKQRNQPQEQQEQQPQSQPQPPVASQLTMGNMDMLITSQIATLAENVSELTAKVDAMMMKIDSLITVKSKEAGRQS